jgi:NTP pyrophosphatase (non-canonical NTP hydrolase)
MIKNTDEEIRTIIESALRTQNLILDVQTLINNLENRGFDSRDRLLRKLVEEVGEYCEAIEYFNGSSKKVKKLQDVATPQEKLKEEIVDVVMMGLALARREELSICDVLEAIKTKLMEHDDIIKDE